ncbi:basic proline-rich protein-like [Molothrus ater]|uniref:basic proline-rich protein-like n=1 Tax=Molothrus ater TaxID=84834 RepID=UPI0017497F01|nr:basic proline-rich protein-like [Molothrus ater]
MLSAQPLARSEVPEQPAKGAGHISAPRHPPCAAPPAPNPAAAACAPRPAPSGPGSLPGRGTAPPLRLRQFLGTAGSTARPLPQLVAAGEAARERRPGARAPRRGGSGLPEPSGSCPAEPEPPPAPEPPLPARRGSRGRWGLRQRGVSAGAEAPPLRGAPPAAAAAPAADLRRHAERGPQPRPHTSRTYRCQRHRLQPAPPSRPQPRRGAAARAPAPRHPGAFTPRLPCARPPAALAPHRTRCRAPARTNTPSLRTSPCSGRLVSIGGSEAVPGTPGGNVCENLPYEG